jgi:primosomal protein N' (replication factor Y) (superfamily II helicase)
MSLVRVALPLPLPRLFDYEALDACEGDVGRCVRVPFGNTEKTGLIVDCLSEPPPIQEGEKTPFEYKPVLSIDRSKPPLPADWLALVGFAARYYHAPLGQMVAVALPSVWREGEATALLPSNPWLALSPEGEEAIGDLRKKALRALLETLRETGPQRLEHLRASFPQALLREAQTTGWLKPLENAPERSSLSALAPEPVAEQIAVLAQLRAHLGKFRSFLLHGITGSGKTEVYLRCAQTVLAQGRQVLFLVPEIGLTPQFEARVRARFPDNHVVCLHSKIAPKRRVQGFFEAMSGHAELILGTRLSIFTPLKAPGLIVVDEEHDPSYRQHEGIRYSARDLAVWRARQWQIPIVLGSATPSLESWNHAHKGHYHLLQMHRRAHAKAVLPRIHLIDLTQQKVPEGLSPSLLRALEHRLLRGEQSLLFLNRRGYAPVLSCPSCGWASPCPHCSAHQVLHRADGRLRCHHCGTQAPIPRVCPSCGNSDILPWGQGTQRVEETLARHFPQARILRLDRDSAHTQGQWARFLDMIAQGQADMVVGTQMLAKGHDFPKVTLVGVLDADSALFSSDFRAPERLFSQLMQVGGRAGRAEHPGEVLIQTRHPAHPLFACLQKHDYAGFAALTLKEREMALFPPFSFQALLCVQAPAIETAMAFLEKAMACLPHAQVTALRVYDPVPMRMMRLAGRERAQLLIESDTRAALHRFLLEWLPGVYAVRRDTGVSWHLDVDPLDL